MNTVGLSESSIKSELAKNLKNKLDSVSEHDLDQIINAASKAIVANNRRISSDIENEIRQ
ncbi:hypothetical protein [Paenibacillus brevis]|uniref:Uncharacterized protein n=1 Tax=Paenibacillus brevis TaxID=2841508 RepID=A0ABS6FTD4_9BACL|nr:hypothetical protein [Paenibacillus brevis]MBU5672673.1 hypothetical protein [Paenibacillus brevis]